ncbi:helix-turn-helix domain-containing protein [Paraflavitalea sp. CAU 1676]|uniref:helix-turn-helix domain-containing protein n=1 Tax=Paraflavitalea sp. CAU 1676 TaxID=3032598 RepID=UPI0023DAA083|nr:helix-turn-helix domain-containing protein [Paraflavitalea sp. CAU 1676]MDF2191098.1 helix-turn-helix domain-containing protein [Paraflavitalea sp. CAU 1676]
MSAPDTSNEYFQLAVRFVNQTNRHLFLTGRAGTGKTTFLKYIQEHCPKKMAVVAPTGVAAINAGGVTMHSFFQLPFGPFLPSRQGGWHDPSINSTDQHTLIKNLRFNSAKRELLRELELLVIDEVSMVRADMLDAIDLILRHFRRQPYTPFGGVQVLFIGDLFQLPPVVTNEEWEGILKYHYASPFFFDSQAVRQAPPLYLELKKIYRQNEANFIDILNNLRNNSTNEEDLRQLHLRYIPGFVPDEDDHYITLTSHNYKADKINQYQLARLQGEVYEFRGEITGDFNEKALPAEMALQLKVGAQVMFIKNDKGEFRRFFNGKLAVIQSISKDNKITVGFPGEDIELEIEQEVWKNIRYSYNKEKDSIEEEELGSFKQYPIRLAWAITIHKSQGLTFRKAIVDAGESFAPGQVYVALSRLTSMDGLILYSRIQPHCISTDERVIAFTSAELAADELQQALQQERKAYIGRSIIQCFDWSKLAAAWEAHYENYEDRQLPEQNVAVLWAQALLNKVNDQQAVAYKFMRQLEQLLTTAASDGYAALQQRMQAAIAYFRLQLEENLASLQQHLDDIKVKQKVKKYVKELQELKQVFERQQQLLEQATLTVNALVRGVPADELLQLIDSQKKAATAIRETAQSVTKGAKGETKRISLQLFKEGKNIEDIAVHRGMAISTIEGHLIQFIATGEIQIEELVQGPKIVAILDAIKEAGGQSITPVKEKLGDEYSFGEIRAVMQYASRLQQENA